MSSASSPSASSPRMSSGGTSGRRKPSNTARKATENLRRISQSYTPVKVQTIRELVNSANGEKRVRKKEGFDWRDLLEKVLLFVSVPAVAFAIVIISVAMDNEGEGVFGFVTLALTHPNHETVVAAVQMLGIMCCGMLGLVCTTSIIVLEMASNRFTPHVAKLFFSDPLVISGLGFYAIVNVYVVWLAFAIAGGYHARYGMLILVVLFTISLALCLPFFVFLFFFVNPKKVIEKIMEEGTRESTNLASKNKQESQGLTIEAIERLSHFALHALNHQDLSLALYATDALCSSTIVYGETKYQMPPEWHVISEATRSSSDYFTLSDRAIEQLQEKKSWYEFKVLKQYQGLFEKSLTTFRALGFRVCVDTREVAESAARIGDFATFDLCVKFMNTFIRKAVNSKDINMICGCLHQYRQMAEFIIINRGQLIAEHNVPDHELNARPVHIVKCMRYYAHLCMDYDMGFVAKVATFDMSIIVKHGILKKLDCMQTLLDTFVSMSARLHINSLTLQGIRQAQVMLATELMVNDDEGTAKIIWKCMVDDGVEILQGVYNDLKYVEEQDFWEVSERNTNIDYISEKQKEKLEVFFGWFPKYKGLMLGSDGNTSGKVAAVASFGLTRSPSAYVMNAASATVSSHHTLAPVKESSASSPAGTSRGGGDRSNMVSRVFEEEPLDANRDSDEDEDEEDVTAIETTGSRRSFMSSSTSYSAVQKIS